MINLVKKAKEATYDLGVAKASKKNNALNEIAKELIKNSDYILEQNKLDLDNAKQLSESMLDRLRLDKQRIDDIANGIKEIINFDDPIGKTISSFTRPNGLKIVKQTVPLGVIAIIYEARPNVTVDAAALCLKSGNVCVLRGGKEAIHTNCALVEIMRQAIAKAGLSKDCISLIKDTSREGVHELMKLNNYVDVLIPRGGKNLIRTICDNSNIPVIRTGEGVCHIYIDDKCDLNMASDIVHNAKCSRPSVCNAVECILVNRNVAKDLFDRLIPLLKDVELRCDKYCLDIIGERGILANDEDWDAEYNDYILAIKTVNNVEEAIDFINNHGTNHSEAIITKDSDIADKFMQLVDASSVYVNASTRFTDGGEFGLGAEIGISTQKVHARGPMGLNELCSYKYLIYGEGQTR